MSLDATPAAVGHLVFGECSQEAGRRPTLLVRTRGEGGPHQLDGRQAQLAQQEPFGENAMNSVMGNRDTLPGVMRVAHEITARTGGAELAEQSHPAKRE